MIEENRQRLIAYKKEKAALFSAAKLTEEGNEDLRITDWLVNASVQFERAHCMINCHKHHATFAFQIDESGNIKSTNTIFVGIFDGLEEIDFSDER